MWVDGTVDEWDSDEGWGTLSSEATPGGCWAHYSSVEMPGFKQLAAGDHVSFT